MSVYVDDMQAGFGRMIMCHMVADTDEELHAMAAKLGMKRSWFQHKPAMPEHDHYDVAKVKRALAVSLGAIEIDRKKLAEIIRKKREQNKNG